MGSPTQTVRLSHDLLAICRTRAKQLNYKDASSYIRGLIRYDAMVQGTHEVTLPIAEQSLETQDRIDARLLEQVRTGISQRGEFFRHLIAQVLEEAKEPTGENIAKQLKK